jgi:hypothetical protein
MLLAILLAALFAGCQPGTQPTETTEGAGGGGTAGAKKPAAVETVTVSVPAGTELAVRLGAAIDTGSTPAGAEFEGTLANALTVNGTEVAPVGSSVAGKVTKVVSSGRLKTPAELSLVLTSLTLKGGNQVAISTSTWSMKGKSHAKRNIGMIGGGAGAGALIGAIAGGKKGAAIGGAVGAGAGTATAAATGKDEIVLAPETALSFKLASALEATLRK